MTNSIITNNDLGSVIFKNAISDDAILTLGGAVTIKEGTILARDSVSLKLVPFAIGGVTNENGIPKAIIAYELTSTGAGDVAIRAMISGEVEKERLVVDADGDDSNITDLELDQLRDFTIVSNDVKELNILDNQ